MSTKPAAALEQTSSLVRQVRIIVRQRDMTAEGLRDELNGGYLHPSDGVSVSTVVKWLSWPIAPMKSESFAALQKWVVDHQTKNKKTNK